MKQTRKYFTQDELVSCVRRGMEESLKEQNVPEVSRSQFCNLDCILSALGIFTFKYPSLLRFDKSRTVNDLVMRNLKNLLRLSAVPCDTYMRERLDQIAPKVLRKAFCNLFSLIQRNKLLDNFQFFGDHYLVSVDGTGVFSSHDIHCENCCSKKHRDGTVTYYHQILAAALVHPDQKVVYPFCPEPIMIADGDQKNDCERNALKRWVTDFRQEHPRLKTIILADGLSSNEPFISILKEKNLSYILVCRETDHKYLTDWVKAADEQDKPSFQETVKGIQLTYEYMLDVPLNESKHDCLVNVVRFSETKKGKTTRWMWVTDLNVTRENIREFVKGARARWKIENETFNTLKNQGYNFEHNFGHGKKHLNTVFACLMLLSFFIDQCLQQVNKLFQAALLKFGSKKNLWQTMLSVICLFEVKNFESMYHFLVHPPPLAINPVI